MTQIQESIMEKTKTKNTADWFNQGLKVKFVYRKRFHNEVSKIIYRLGEAICNR